MQPLFPLAPRYRLDDEQPWLEGIDPARNYWIRINGEEAQTVVIPGLLASSFAEFRTVIQQFRSLQPGAQMKLGRGATTVLLHCISNNCYAVEVQGAAVWHLFDEETLDSLLMTAHPDWICSEKGIELGRRMLLNSLAHTLAA
jgi:hypothetical protein